MSLLSQAEETKQEGFYSPLNAQLQKIVLVMTAWGWSL